jgi:hypothetical protein
VRSYAVGDPFQLVGDHCAKVHLSHVLRHHMAQGPLPKCLRVMHLAWEGHVRLDSLTAIWDHLPEFLLAELFCGFWAACAPSVTTFSGILPVQTPRSFERPSRLQKSPTPACIVAPPGKVALTSDMNAHSGRGTRDRSPSPWPDTWRRVEILSGSTQSPDTTLCLFYVGPGLAPAG